jgi:hypothetical protein
MGRPGRSPLHPPTGLGVGGEGVRAAYEKALGPLPPTPKSLILAWPGPSGPGQGAHAGALHRLNNERGTHGLSGC